MLQLEIRAYDARLSCCKMIRRTCFFNRGPLKHPDFLQVSVWFLCCKGRIRKQNRQFRTRRTSKTLLSDTPPTAFIALNPHRWKDLFNGPGAIPNAHSLEYRRRQVRKSAAQQNRICRPDNTLTETSISFQRGLPSSMLRSDKDSARPCEPEGTG
jgi:hypothetical protein